MVLAHRKDQCHVDGHAGGDEFFQGVEPGGRGRRFDHPILMPRRPLAPQPHVLGDPLRVRQVQLRVFQQRIDLEADVAVVAAGRLPHGQEDLLGVAHQQVGHLPGDFVVVEPLPGQPIDVRVEPSGGHQIGHDDRVRRCAGGAGGSIRADQIGVDRVEPEFRTRRQQRFDGIWHERGSPKVTCRRSQGEGDGGGCRENAFDSVKLSSDNLLRPLRSLDSRELLVGKLSLSPRPLLGGVAFDQPTVDEVGNQTLHVELRVKQLRPLQARIESPE